MTAFESTIPFGEPELLRVSAYQRYLKELEQDAVRSGVSTRISSLSPSLRADLLRFEGAGRASEALEVLAACVRHAKRVTVHLRFGARVVPLTVFPDERLVHTPVPVQGLLDHATELGVLHVEPAILRPPGDADAKLIGPADEHHPLAPLLWSLAMRGSRAELLPEIAGPAVYRVSPNLPLSTLPLEGALRSAVQRLRRESHTLRDIAEWPGLDRERAARLLNALYVQAGLIVSRSHPDAVRESWFGGLGR